MKSSAYSQLVDSFAPRHRARRQSGGSSLRHRYPLASGYGKIQTAFPEGRPKAEDRSEKKAKAPEAKPDHRAAQGNGKRKSRLLLVGERFHQRRRAVRPGRFFGQRIVIRATATSHSAQALWSTSSRAIRAHQAAQPRERRAPFTVILTWSEGAAGLFGKIKEWRTTSVRRKRS